MTDQIASDEFGDDLVGPDSADLPERFFDRFVFNLHAEEALAPAIILGFGIYPVRNVADGFLIVTTSDEQRNLRFSTELDATDRHGAGPFSFDVVEPLKSWRLSVGPNATGVELDVLWTARTSPWWQSLQVATTSGEPTAFDHLVQSGRYTGRMRLDGKELDVSGWYGQRDRSRGVRSLSGGQGIHIWFQAQFPDRSVGFLLVESRDQSRIILEGSVMGEDGSLDDIVDVTHDLTFDDLDLVGGVVEIVTASGRRERITADASVTKGGYLAGGGYGGHHGKQRGRDHVESEVYRLDGSVTPRGLDSSMTDRLTAFECKGVAGSGIFEFAISRSSSYTYRATLVD